MWCPGTGSSVWAVHTGRSSCWTTASSFRQPPSTPCSTVSTWYLRPSHLRCRWTNDMELVPKQFAWAGHANWLFSSYTEDVSFWTVLGTLSTLEALFFVMTRYINWHLHYMTTVATWYSWTADFWANFEQRIIDKAINKWQNDCVAVVGFGFSRHRPSSRYCCYGNHAAGSKPFKNFLT